MSIASQWMPWLGRSDVGYQAALARKRISSPRAAHLLQAAQDQSESGVCGKGCRGETGERPHLVRHLHAVTIWATSTTRPGGSSRSTTRLVRKCYPCVRNRPVGVGVPNGSARYVRTRTRRSVRVAARRDGSQSCVARGAGLSPLSHEGLHVAVTPLLGRRFETLPDLK